MGGHTRESQTWGSPVAGCARLIGVAVAAGMSFWAAGCEKPVQPLPLPARPHAAVPQPAPPQPDDAALLFPHRVGDRWVLEMAGEEQKYQIEMTVKPGSEAAGPHSFYMETTRDGKLVSRDLYVADDRGVSFAGSELPAPTKIDPPMPLLKRPIHPNSSWSWVGTFKIGAQEWPAAAAFQLSGPESLKTPSGEFEAFRLTQKVTLKTGTQDVVSTTTQWLAPKVGTVRQTTDNPNQKGDAVLLSSKVGD